MFDFALAYLDPGSGSLIIQVIIASILAVPYFLRTQIGRAVGRLRGGAKPEPTASPTDEGSAPSEHG